jgi:hypothetical protein
LERGEQGDREVVAADARREVPDGGEGAHPVGDDGRPPLEAARDEVAGLGIRLGKLAAQRPKGAAAPRVGAPSGGDNHVAPGTQSLDGGQPGLLGAADDGAGLVVDDRLDELVLAGEVVRQLRAANLRRGPDVLEGGAGHAPLVDQPGGGVHDPGSSPLPLRGQPRPTLHIMCHVASISTFWV